MLICLDVDGCLVDSDVPMVRAMNAALSEMDLLPVNLADLRPLLGPPLIPTLARLLTSRDERAALAEELASRYRAHYAQESLEHAVAYPDVREALLDLVASGTRCWWSVPNRVGTPGPSLRR